MRSRKWLWLVLIAALALVPAACGRDDGGGGGGGGGAKRRSRHHRQGDQARRLLSVQRPRLGLRHDRRGRQGLLQVPQRQGRRERPQDRLHHARRRLRAAEGAAERAPARPAGQGLRDVQHARARRTTSRSGTSSTSRRCRSSTSPPARRTGARTSRRTRTRSAGSRTTSPRPRSTPTTSRRTSRTPRSPCSTRTTASARTCSAASRRASRARDIKVVEKETYNVTDPTVAAQVGRLARSGADTFLNITTPKFSAQAIATVAKSGWKPLHILNNVGADKNLVLKPVGLENAKGIVSTAYFKDPQDRAVGRRRRGQGVPRRAQEVRAEVGPRGRVQHVRLDGRARRWRRRSSR